MNPHHQATTCPSLEAEVAAIVNVQLPTFCDTQRTIAIETLEKRCYWCNSELESFHGGNRLYCNTCSTLGWRNNMSRQCGYCKKNYYDRLNFTLNYTWCNICVRKVASTKVPIDEINGISKELRNVYTEQLIRDLAPFYYSQHAYSDCNSAEDQQRANPNTVHVQVISKNAVNHPMGQDEPSITSVRRRSAHW